MDKDIEKYVNTEADVAQRWLIETQMEDGAWEEQQTLPFQEDAIDTAFGIDQEGTPARVVDCKYHKVIWSEGEWVKD